MEDIKIPEENVGETCPHFSRQTFPFLSLLLHVIYLKLDNWKEEYLGSKFQQKGYCFKICDSYGNGGEENTEKI